MRYPDGRVVRNWMPAVMSAGVGALRYQGNAEVLYICRPRVGGNPGKINELDPRLRGDDQSIGATQASHPPLGNLYRCENKSVILIILKNSVEQGVPHSWFDGLTTNGILGHHPEGKTPFALSSPRSGRIEGSVITQLSFRGLLHSPKAGANVVRSGNMHCGNQISVQFIHFPA